MSTAPTHTHPHAAHAPASGLSFGGVLHSEWIKLHSLRSTLWCYLFTVVVMIGFGFLLASVYSSDVPLTEAAQQGVWVQVATIGINFGQLIVAVLGALVITGEFGTGMIRSTFAAVPKRFPALLAKVLVFGVTTFVISLIAVAGTAALTAPVLPARGVQPDFGDSAVWLACVGGAGYLALIGVMSLGIGTIIRSSAGGIAASLGLILVIPIILRVIAGVTNTQWPLNILAFLPSEAGARMFAYTVDEPPPPPDTITLEPWQGLLVLAGWFLAAFVGGAILLQRRDA